MTLARAAVRATSWSFIETAGVQLVSFALFALLARLIDPAAFGVLQIANTFSGFAWILAEQGVTVYLQQRSELSSSTLNTAFWLGVTLSSLLAACLWGVAPVVGHVYKVAEVVPVLQWISLQVPLAGLCWVHAALLTRELSYDVLARRRLAALLIGGCLGVAVALSGHGVWSLVAKQLGEAFSATVLTWLACPWRPRAQVDVREVRPMLEHGSRVTLGHLLGHFTRRVDDLLIGFVLGPVVLGYYALAIRAITLAHEVAVGAAHRTAVPIFARLQSDIARMGAAYRRATELVAAVATPVFFGLSAVSQELCITVFGPDRQQAVPIMQRLGLSGTAVAGSLFFAPILLATGRTRTLLRYQLVFAVLGVVCTLTGAHWGALGVALAYNIRSYAWLLAGIFAMQQVLGASITEQAKPLLAPLVSSCLMLAAVSMTRASFSLTSPFVNLALLSTIGAVVYVSTMLLLGRSSLRALWNLLGLKARSAT